MKTSFSPARMFANYFTFYLCTCISFKVKTQTLHLCVHNLTSFYFQHMFISTLNHAMYVFSELESGNVTVNTFPGKSIQTWCAASLLRQSSQRSLAWNRKNLSKPFNTLSDYPLVMFHILSSLASLLLDLLFCNITPSGHDGDWIENWVYFHLRISRNKVESEKKTK